MCHLPPGTENRVCARALGARGGGGGATAHITASTGGRGASKGAMGDTAGGGGGWDKHPGGILGGGGGDGTSTLVQPHYPTPTKSVNPEGARGGKPRDNNQGEAGGGDSKEM